MHNVVNKVLVDDLNLVDLSVLQNEVAQRQGFFLI